MMRTNRVAVRWRTVAVGAAVVGLMLGVVPSSARAAVGDEARCPRGETPVRIDERTCPALKQRPSFVVRRACCAHVGNGKVRCGNMPHCPTNSPS